MLCSSGAGMWVGNAIQVLTDSTWNHVAMVVRGHMTFDEEADQAPHGDDISRHSDVKRFAKHRDRSPYHFHVEVDEGTCGTPHLLEASGEGVHMCIRTSTTGSSRRRRTRSTRRWR